MNDNIDLATFTGVVLFSAHWCTPCQHYKPALTAWAKSRGVRLHIIDVGDDRELAAEYGVKAVPTTMLMQEGVPVRGFTGAKTEAALDATLGA